MYLNKKIIEYANKMKKARQSGELENAVSYFEKLMMEVKKVRKDSKIDERKNDFSFYY
ncbi:MAG: hypothetical protein H8E64_07250 [Candidatus Marinimicrobia bacterium]|nr:hypothetical protein [Candidatus Neomarinimicrobiota bacterium]